jgi:hypothetical protein
MSSLILNVGLSVDSQEPTSQLTCTLLLLTKVRNTLITNVIIKELDQENAIHKSRLVVVHLETLQSSKEIELLIESLLTALEQSSISWLYQGSGYVSSRNKEGNYIHSSKEYKTTFFHTI